MLFTAALCTPVIAGDGDAIHPFVGLGYSYEDNLLRLPDEHPGFGGQRSDALRQAIAGILFDRTYSRQHIFVQGKVTKVNFDHFKQLDYDGKDLLGRWRWEAGRQFSGTLEASYLETLSSFTDFHNGERNLREQRHMLADVAWRMHPSWRLRGAVSEDEFSYELPSLFFNNRKEKRAEAGIDFVSRSGNYAGVVLRRLDGEYPNKRIIGGTLIDEDFQQDEVKARVYWRASGATTLDLLAGWAKRKHAMLGERDASGVNGRATVVYTPRGKTRFTAAVWRDFAPIENTVVASSLNKGASLNVDYLATAKTRLNASVRKEKRNYSVRISTPAAVELSDSLRYASLGATYAATRNIQVSVNGFRESRKGGQALGLHSYRAKGASFSVNVQF
ncbi:XrtB/PEP-CTERM-associated polysaccharide biosynthesis outer membrane protein EpsL [Pseudoduganella sp. GCM10020061]|uniref:XrtB/PEP-CTERM-associated polysaccharide biosynthesis outer membrane protein EpsL n=1 Tax=Pseudoduganella sp. GCM10020061 TaxID=3317345 RepID=UPI0036445CED